MRKQTFGPCGATGSRRPEAVVALSRFRYQSTCEMHSDSGGRQENKRSTPWATRFALFGTILPLVCLILDFQPPLLKSVCELCWPSAFLLLAADGHFNLAIYSSSIAINGVIWASLGWLIGYGLSGGSPGPNRRQ